MRIMSSAEGWDLTVPEDAEELAAELRRHGMTPGQTLHFEIQKTVLGAVWIRKEHFIAEIGDNVGEPVPRPVPRFKFMGAGHGAPPDLSERADEYLAQGFGGFGQA